VVSSFWESLIPLYFIYLSKRPLRGRTKLQKLVFLLQMKTGIGVDYQFAKGYYGPYSFKLHLILDSLKSMGFVHEKSETTSSGNTVIQYQLSPSGKSFVTFACEKGRLPLKIRESIEKIHKEYGILSLIELINRVYEEFPEWAENSIFLSP